MTNPFIVAEIGANHLGDYERAKDLVLAASNIGADAVKFQTWTPDSMCISPEYELDSGPWKGRKLFDLYREAFLPWAWHQPLFELAREIGLVPFSAAFDIQAVDFLETIGVDRHKCASFELTDLRLIRHMASTGKTVILSTGMATQDEMDAAWHAAEKAPKRLLLKCTSAYPAEPEDANLCDLAFFNGISDHTQGIGIAVAAAGMGAEYIEKHLTLSRADGGLDAGFSMEPNEFRQMVTECRRAASAWGKTTRYTPAKGEDRRLRRSLWVNHDVKRGEPLQLGINVVTARPCLGLHPATPLTYKIARRDISAGTPLTAELLA